MQIRRRPPNLPVKVYTLRYQVKIPDSDPKHILEEIVWHKETEVGKMCILPTSVGLSLPSTF